jgi:hypothetical protein
LAYFIGERYFFDTLFYKKSIAHGYWVNKKNTLADFGRRSEDIVNLLSTENQDNRHVLGTQGDGSFNIAVIGDSFVWGQGLRDEERFVHLLQEKLDVLRKTKVYSFAWGGDNIFDNFAKYQTIQSTYPIDVYIFFLVGNDLLIKDLRYQHDATKTVSDYCRALTGGEQVQDSFATSSGPEAFMNVASLCSLDVMSRVYPTEKSIYFYIDDYPGFNLYIESFAKTGHYLVSARKAQHIPKYSKYFGAWGAKNESWKFVSKKDRHSSSIANSMFSDVLFNEIISSQVWRFRH